MISSFFTRTAWRHALEPPPWYWWIEPSGGAINPPPWPWWQYILESPLGAHSLNAWLTWGFGYLVTGGPWTAYFVAVGFAVAIQLSKADALLPLGRYSMREVIWRLVIGAGAALLPIGLVG